MQTYSLTPLDLSLAAIFVISLAIISRISQLGIGKRILISALRTTVQLLLVGLVLSSLFSHVKPLWVGLMAFVMLCAATREVIARQKNPLKGSWGIGIGSLSMFISSFVITSLALIVLINQDPWYTPRYAIPLLGMMLGNTMNGVAIGMDRLTQTARDQRKTIEARLMMGQSWSEAIADIRRDSIRAGMIPIINAMAIAGLVSLPGMMTGQILAGTPPFEAVKYQIMIMFLIAAGTGFGSIFAVSLTAKRLFDSRHRLCLNRLKKQ